MTGRALTPQEQVWLELAQHIARPSSARLTEARAALAPYDDASIDPRAAWEALVAQGLMPDVWATRGPRDVARVSGGGLSHAAESIAALAADPAGVAAVEALVADLVARLAPWLDTEPAQVQWRTIPVGALAFPIPQPFAASPAFAAIEALFTSTTWTAKEDAALKRSVERAFRPVSGRPSGTVTNAKPPVRAGDPPWFARFWDRVSAGQHAIYHATNRALWEASVERALTVTRHENHGRPFAEMLDPAEVLLDVWRLGYVVGEVNETAVVVYAPERWTP